MSTPPFASLPGGKIPVGQALLERLYVERLYDFYQHRTTRVESLSNRCLKSLPQMPRLAAWSQPITDH